jgi:hypothetical protein
VGTRTRTRPAGAHRARGGRCQTVTVWTGGIREAGHSCPGRRDRRGGARRGTRCRRCRPRAEFGWAGPGPAREMYVEGQRTVLEWFAARERPPDRYFIRRAPVSTATRVATSSTRRPNPRRRASAVNSWSSSSVSRRRRRPRQASTGLSRGWLASILIQRENPTPPVSDECSDAQSEPRNEQGVNESKLSFAHQKSKISEDGRESRKLWAATAETVA